MSSEIPTTTRVPMIGLLGTAMDKFSDELYERVQAAGLKDIRPGHGCVFSNIEPAGSRLTDLAERARMTKQTVGEVASDLERLGYAERVPDPADGRAKIIRLTSRGHEAQATGRGLVEALELDWGERYGEENVAALRRALEAVTAERFGSWT